MKAIHNILDIALIYTGLFQTTKIQTFESNSQQEIFIYDSNDSCFKLQRYKLLKAIHNEIFENVTNNSLFQTTKIQTFESNSQRDKPDKESKSVVSNYKNTNF